MRNILFIHGYNGYPYGRSYELLRSKLNSEKYKLHTIDYDANDPETTIHNISEYCKTNNISIVIGTSLGGFLALNLWNIPKIVHNVCWLPSVELLKIGMSANDSSKYMEYEANIKDWSGRIEDSFNTFGVFTDEDELLGTKYREPFARSFSKPIISHGGHVMNDECATIIVDRLIPKLETYFKNEEEDN